MRRVYEIENLQSKVDGVLVRPVHQDDAADLYDIISRPEVSRTLIHMPSIEFTDTVEFVSRRDKNNNRLVAEVDGRAVASGTLSASQNPRMRHAGSLGMMVHPDYWNRRVGTAVMTGLLNLADNWLNLKRVELGVFAENEYAIRLYEKFGFEIECRMRENIFGDGRFHDEYFMARLRGFEGIQASTEPRKFETADGKPRPDVSSLKVRALHPEDVDDLYHIWSNPKVGRSTMQLPSQEWWWSKERIDKRPPGYHRFVADLDGKAVGMSAISVSQNPRMGHTGNLGMIVAPGYWGLGIGSRLMEAVLDLADNWLNLRRVELEVHTDNPAAVHLYEKYDFEIEGTERFHTFGDGRWTDTYLMSRLNGVD
jgi:putative acetyltransferase